MPSLSASAMREWERPYIWAAVINVFIKIITISSSETWNTWLIWATHKMFGPYRLVDISESLQKVRAQDLLQRITKNGYLMAKHSWTLQCWAKLVPGWWWRRRGCWSGRPGWCSPAGTRRRWSWGSASLHQTTKGLSRKKIVGGNVLAALAALLQMQ